MIDIRRMRTEPDAVRANLARRKIDLTDLNRAAELDELVREVSARRDDARSQVKTLSKAVGEAHKSGDKAAAEAASSESRAMGETEKALDAEVSRIEAELHDLMLGIPNLISADVPDGASDADNPIIVPSVERDWSEHQRVPHWVIGEELGILDPEHAVRMSGSMFQMFRGGGATLARALLQYALDRNADMWEEILPPTLVKTETMVATGHLPKFDEEQYAVERDGLWTIPTAEVPLTSIARDEILAEDSLPLRMMAATPCFRREAGSAGKDTRGLLRLHEFQKVELMAYMAPDQAEGVLFEILDRAKRTMEELGFQYRVIEICTGDLGSPHHRSFDVEAYAPGVDAWLEVSSCSWYTDYQARRANVRFKPNDGGANQIVHTCNGSALPVPRVWATLVETHRQPDGSVKVPEVLKPYMRGIEYISAPTK